MGKLLAVLYGVLSYAFFFAVFLYAIAFVEDLPVPKTIDSGTGGPLVPTLIIDALLLGVFAIQHSVMARPAFKAWWTKIVPAQIERSTYVLLASLALALVCWQWRPLPQNVWTLEGIGLVATVLLAIVSYAGLADRMLSRQHLPDQPFQPVRPAPGLRLSRLGPRESRRRSSDAAVLSGGASPTLFGLYPGHLRGAGHEPRPPDLRGGRRPFHSIVTCSGAEEHDPEGPRGPSSSDLPMILP